MEHLPFQTESEPTFNDYYTQFHKAYSEDEKRKILAQMERVATTIEQLKLVDSYVLPDTSMKTIIANRIKMLETPQQEQEAA